MWKFVYPVENQFKECVWSASDWLHGRTLEKEGAGKLPGLSDTFLNSESKTRVYFFYRHYEKRLFKWCHFFFF